MIEQKEWNIVFLLDKKSPEKIVMLKRSSDKSYAPNFYTGIGGKVETEDKTILDSAYRELKEESGIDNVELTEFARCVIDNKFVLYYFWGIYEDQKLPVSDDGILEWVKTDKIFDKEIIPTTRNLCEQWSKRGFSIDLPFTVFLREIGMKGTVKLLELVEVREGLI